MNLQSYIIEVPQITPGDLPNLLARTGRPEEIGDVGWASVAIEKFNKRIAR